VGKEEKAKSDNGNDSHAPLPTSLASEHDSPRDVADKMSEKYELSNAQGAQIEQYIADKGLGYVLEKDRLTDSEPRENAGRYFMAALRDDFKAPKRTIKPKLAKLRQASQAKADPRDKLSDAELKAQATPLREFRESYD
jgi:hypothetical protein